MGLGPATLLERRLTFFFGACMDGDSMPTPSLTNTRLLRRSPRLRMDPACRNADCASADGCCLGEAPSSNGGQCSSSSAMLARLGRVGDKFGGAWPGAPSWEIPPAQAPSSSNGARPPESSSESPLFACDMTHEARRRRAARVADAVPSATPRLLGLPDISGASVSSSTSSDPSTCTLCAMAPGVGTSIAALSTLAAWYAPTRRASSTAVAPARERANASAPPSVSSIATAFGMLARAATCSGVIPLASSPRFASAPASSRHRSAGNPARLSAERHSWNVTISGSIASSMPCCSRSRATSACFAARAA
mmetsp:Transcript_39202/g.116613  ORF Transcript_39202/g.116613 Transcript_39202/m.116613 type:complete len:308 (-) Transcript_39202:219-1142(-)